MPIHIPHPISDIQHLCFPESKGHYEGPEKRVKTGFLDLKDCKTSTSAIKSLVDNEKGFIKAIVGDIDVPKSGSSLTSTGFDWEENNY